VEIFQKWLSLKDTNAGIWFCYLFKETNFPKMELEITKSYQNCHFLPVRLLSISERYQNGNPDSVELRKRIGNCTTHPYRLNMSFFCWQIPKLSAEQNAPNLSFVC
jgi:hypothetical protein